MTASLKKKKVSKKKKVTKKASKVVKKTTKKAKTKKTTSKKATKFAQGKHPNQIKTLKKNEFKKGQSGNPEGRPKGSANFKTIINHILSREMTASNLNELVSDKSRTRSRAEKAHIKRLCEAYGGKLTYREAIILAQVMNAIRGDTSSFNALADREEGKPKQMIATTTASYEDFLDELPDE